MKNNKTFVLACMIFSIGVIMLFGSSYSLINSSVMTDEEYGFNVANFDVDFQDSTKISLNSVPSTDDEGLNSKEYTFTVSNNSNFDVNYKLDIIENSMFSMSDVIKYVYSLNDGKYTDINILKKNFTINQNRVLKRGAKDTYKLKIWLSIDADETYMNKKFSASINLIATANEFKYATSVIRYLEENKKDGIKKVDDVYRYIGKDALNYVWFNCRDSYTKGEDYCEKWRIIGSFKNALKNNDEMEMLKITSNTIKAEVSFNNDELNEDYDNSYISTYANGFYYDNLNSHAKDLIMMARWFIGSSKALNYSNSLKDEKKKEVYEDIGLLNASDYLYLGKNNWLKTDGNIILLNKNNVDVNILDNKIIKGDSEKEYGFMPVVYLKPDVSIVSGDGSMENPYELVIKYPLNYGDL